MDIIYVEVIRSGGRVGVGWGIWVLFNDVRD